MTLGKDSRKMAKTELFNNEGTPFIYDIAVPTQSTGGTGTGDVFENADTQDAISTAGIIKYVNLHIEACVRKDTAPANPGWIEYAVFYRMEESGTPVINSAFAANNGTQTLGDIATNLYRDKTIWSGAIPVAAEQPAVLELGLKCPPQFCKWKRGMYLQVVCFFRSSNSADVSSSARIIISHNYKCYT